MTHTNTAVAVEFEEELDRNWEQELAVLQEELREEQRGELQGAMEWLQRQRRRARIEELERELGYI